MTNRTTDAVISPSNVLLDRALPATRAALQSAGVWHVLAAGESLGSADALLTSVHFPFAAVVGVASEADGISCAVASFGNDGFTGIPLPFGMSRQLHTFVTDRPGPVLVVPTEAVVHALEDDAPFREAVQLFVNDIARQKASAVACTALHVVRQRLARRLLVLWERSERPHTLPMARSTVARFAGADQRTAARALRELHGEGAVTPLGANLTIDDPARLASLACRCRELDERAMQDASASA